MSKIGLSCTPRAGLSIIAHSPKVYKIGRPLYGVDGDTIIALQTISSAPSGPFVITRQACGRQPQKPEGRFHWSTIRGPRHPPLNTASNLCYLSGPEKAMPQSPSTPISMLLRCPTHTSTSTPVHNRDLALSSKFEDGRGPDLAPTESVTQRMSLAHEILFVSLLCSAQFTTQVGLLNTLNILHIIGNDLRITSPGVLSWLVAGYSLTVGTFILLSGRYRDLFGYKTMVTIWFSPCLVPVHLMAALSEVCSLAFGR